MKPDDPPPDDNGDDAQRNDKRDDDKKDFGSRPLPPWMVAVCRVIHYRRDGTERTRFPFSDLPVWLAITAGLVGWNMMSAATYFGIKTQALILCIVFLVMLLGGKKKGRKK